METSEIRSVTADDVWAMFLKSWELVKFNYGLTAVICFFLAVGAALSSFPLIGPLCTGLVTAFAPLVFLTAARRWENGEESSVDELINVLKNKELVQRMLPLILIQIVIYAAPAMIAQIPYLAILLGGLGILTMPALAVLGVAYPILFFNSGLTYQKSFSLALDGVVKNIGPFLVGLCMTIALLAVTAVFLVIPLFAIGLPVVFVYQYVWYRVIYEGMEIEIPDKAII